MFSLDETLHLEAGETVRALYRRHGFTVVARIIPYALFLVLLFVFIFPLFSLGLRGAIIFFALCVASAVLAIRKIVAWLGTITILTSSRLLVIQRFGLFKKKVNEIKLDQISEISYEVKGMAQTVCKYGTLYLLVTFTSASIAIPDIPDPQNALNEISQCLAAQKKNPLPTQAGQSITTGPSIEQAKNAKQPAEPSFTFQTKRDPANWR